MSQAAMSQIGAVVQRCRTIADARSRFAALAIPILVAALSSNGVQAATTVFRSVDANGNVVFSDRPPPRGQAAETIEIQDPASFRAPAPATANQNSTWDWDMTGGEEREEGPFLYGALAIVAPVPDETIRENAGNVTVMAAVEPDLRPNHQLEILLNGELVVSVTGTSATLSEVERGTHTIQARIVDESGAILIASEPSTFHLQRYAPMLAPNRQQPTPHGN